MLGPLSMGCRQGELTARPYNAADAVLFLRRAAPTEAPRASSKFSPRALLKVAMG